MAVDLSGVNFFMPVFSFLFVFILVYAILAKIKIFGDNPAVHLFISFLFAIFFIVNTSLVDFVKFSSAWFVVFLICIFLMIVLVSFTHGNFDAIAKPWVAWVLVGALIGFFIISSSFVFNWAVNWAKVWEWCNSDWFGFVLLLIIAAIVSWVLVKK